MVGTFQMPAARVRFAGAVLLLSLFAGAAAADGAEERVRALIDSHRSSSSLTHWTLEFPPLPKADAAGPLACELSRDDYWRLLYRFVRFEPGEMRVWLRSA